MMSLSRGSDTPPAAVEQAWDYIVVGGGSAGCVLANRLSAQASLRVLLLEAGGPDHDPRLRDVVRHAELHGSPFDWNYRTEPEDALLGRQIAWPRGRVLGGTSSINAMIYIRGAAAGFDQWAALGNPGWGFNELLPLFTRAERNASFAGPFHGITGELHVEHLPSADPLGEAFLEAAEELGFGADPRWDFNGAEQAETAGFYQHTIKEGLRHSAASAFLTPLLPGQPAYRPNLQVRPWAFVEQLEFCQGRAAGVRYRDGDGVTRRAEAAREIVLAAGAVDSPRLLLRSGIGPADHLRGLGIAVQIDLPGVGRNLQDHPVVFYTVLAKGTPPAGLVPCGGLFTRSGVGAAGGAAGGAAEGTVEGAAGGTGDRAVGQSADLQFHPYLYPAPNGKRALFGIGVTLVRPQSRGRLALRSADPTAAPRIEPRYLSARQDLEVLGAGLRLAERFAQSAPLVAQLRKPAPPFQGDLRADPAALEAAIRQTATTLYHPVGTCKMGHDPLAVVDHQLRVHGVAGLRIADASVMPVIVNGNTNAACMMIGEKAADLILASIHG